MEIEVFNKALDLLKEKEMIESKLRNLETITYCTTSEEIIKIFVNGIGDVFVDKLTFASILVSGKKIMESKVNELQKKFDEM